MNPVERLRRIAVVEFGGIFEQADILDVKLRLLLKDGSYLDVWVSKKLTGRFGFHWEQRHLGGKMYRYDNFPDTGWSSVPTFPFHFHDGQQNAVTVAPFAPSTEQGFREFMAFVQRAMAGRSSP